jgi:hypothetical protein
VYNGVTMGTLPHVPVHPTFPLVYHFNGMGPSHSMLNGMGNRTGIGFVVMIVFSLCLVGPSSMPNSVATYISQVAPFICWCMQLHVHVGLKVTPCLVIHMQL